MKFVAICAVFLLLFERLSAFRPSQSFVLRAPWTQQQHALHMLPDPSSLSSLDSLLLSLDTFDGASLVDPVVVSNVFWTSLQHRIISVVIGQVLASLVFAALAALASKNSGRITQAIAAKLSFLNNVPQQTTTSTTKKALKKIPRQRAHQPDLGKLAVCLLIDTIGTSSEIIPFLGEVTDIVWAPIAGLLLRNLYASNNLLFALEFAEELLPFTDFLPLATICWVVYTYLPDSNVAKVLQIGDYTNQSGVVDVTTVDAMEDSNYKQKDLER
jgi:hypothetical protein